MVLNEQNILFFTRTMKSGGTENVVLQLCEILMPYVNKIVVCSCGGVNVEKLNKMKIRHYTIPDISERKPIDVIQIYLAIKKIIRNEKVTVIHSHHRMAAFYTNLAAGKKIIKIANAHNTFYDKKRMTQIAYKGTNIISVGEKVKNNLTEYYRIPKNQVTVIHNAVKAFNGKSIPIKEFAESRKNGNLLIGNIGRLTEQKGMEYFIAASAKVYQKYQNIRFYIVGDGEDADRLKRIAHERLSEGVLEFLGYRPDIQNVISQLDFIVLSSLWEGLPLTPIEAYSVGKTIVATAVDGTVEIVRDGVDGFLAEPGNADAIADKIIYLIEHPEKRKDMEKAVLERYESEFTFEKLTQAYIEYYERLLSNE